MGSLFSGKRNISLTGFMFTGKTSVGRMLAGRLGLHYVDLDEEITGLAGASVEDIFSRYGEEHFRKLEQKTLQNVFKSRGVLIATGGGVVTEDKNRRLLLEKSCVIWLKACKKTILDRFRHSRGKPRPLLLEATDPEAVIASLLEAREPFYAQCNLSVDTDGLKVREVSKNILRLLMPETQKEAIKK